LPSPARPPLGILFGNPFTAAQLCSRGEQQ